MVHRVVTAVNNSLFDELVCWPNNSAEFANAFYGMHGMPSVGGLIDGTLINIKTPSENEE